MAYRVSPMPVSLGDLESHFSYLKAFYNSRTSGNIACINYGVFTHESENVRGM